MMLLIGMKMSLTKKPTNPITTNPMAVRTATFENSANGKDAYEYSTSRRGEKREKKKLRSRRKGRKEGY